MRRKLVTHHTMFYARTIAAIGLWLYLFCAGAVAAEQPLVIAGTGDSQSLLRLIAERFMAQHPGYPIDIPDSIGSGGGIRGVLKERFEMARTARPLKPDEQDGTLVEYPFALSPIVFCAEPSVSGVKDLSSAQVIGIFTGAITRWDRVGGPPAPIYPVDREAGDSSRTIIEQRMAGFKAARSIAKIFYTTPETVEAIAEHHYTLGFLPLGLAKSHGLAIFSIDGVSPDRDSVGNGRYPYVTVFYLVCRGRPSKSARMFIDYLYRKDGVDIIEQQGLIPVERKNCESLP